MSYGIFVFNENFYHNLLSYTLLGIYDTKVEAETTAEAWSLQHETPSEQVFILELLGEIVIFEHEADGSFSDLSWYNYDDEVEEDGWVVNSEDTFGAKYYHPERDCYGFSISIDE